MIALLANGAVLGLTAGMSPGPLMALILAESLRGGWPAGFRVAFAPLVTDTVLVSTALLLLWLAAGLPGPWLAGVSVVGGLIIMRMGWGVMRSPVAEPSAAAVTGTEAAPGNPLMRGIATNLLNPQAFLFWLTAGGPILRDAYTAQGLAGPLSFMTPFFVVMISVNLVLSLSISGGRHLLKGAGYQWTLRLAGLLLAAMGAWRVWAGVQGLL